MHCVSPSLPDILAPPAAARHWGRTQAPPRLSHRDGTMTSAAATMPGTLPLTQLAERARAGDDACRLELLARWCADPQADPRLGDAVWEQFRRLLYRWIHLYMAQRGLAAELLTEADEPVDDAVDSLAARILMRFFQSQGGQGLAERFPSMGHVNRFLARVTWSQTGEVLGRQLKHRRQLSPLPEIAEGPAGEGGDERWNEGLGDGPVEAAFLAHDPSQAADARFGQSAVWQRLRALCQNEAEWVAMVERFVHERPPREILARHPDLFSSIDQLYRTIERVMVRLRKDPALDAAGKEGVA